MTLQELKDLIEQIEADNCYAMDWPIVIGAYLPDDGQPYVGQIKGVSVEEETPRVVLDLGNWQDQWKSAEK